MLNQQNIMDRRSMFHFAPWSCLRLGLLLLFCVTTIQYEGVDGYMVGNNPNRRLETLDSQAKYILEWEVDWSAKRISFNVSVATRGYVGFGLSDKGKMSGADIVIGGVLPNGQSYFSDRHAVGNQLPEVDSSQDWDLHDARENATHTFLSFSRPFDTCDPQDYPIVEDKVSLIWAFGERDDQLEYHHRNRGEFPVHLLSPDYTPPIKRDANSNPLNFRSPYNEDVKVWSWNIPFTMPAEETTYWCSIYKGPTLYKKHHMIGFEMRFNDEVSRKHLHHIIISKCHAPQGFNEHSMFDRHLGQGQICYAAGGRSQSLQVFNGPLPLEYCTDYLIVTAVGDRIHFLPPHVGNPFGGETRDEYYMIQSHYDNPELRNGIRVNVNLDVYYTPQLRQNEGDLMAIRHESPGLPASHLIPPSSIAHTNIGICGSECSRKIFPEEGIRVQSVLLHLHNSGVGIRVRHFRGKRELPFIAAEDNFAFNYQQMRVLPKEVHILPGDQILVECVSDSVWKNGTVVGGFSTRQEMCAAWLMYYTRIPSKVLCASEIDSPEFRESFLGIQNVSWSNQHLEYVVDSPRRFAGLPITQVSDMLEWTLSQREELQRFQLTHPHMNRCPVELYARAHTMNENGEPVDLQPEESVGRLIPVPKPTIPYTPPQSCSVKVNNPDTNEDNDRTHWESNRSGSTRSEKRHQQSRNSDRTGRWGKTPKWD